MSDVFKATKNKVTVKTETANGDIYKSTPNKQITQKYIDNQAKNIITSADLNGDNAVDMIDLVKAKKKTEASPSGTIKQINSEATQNIRDYFFTPKYDYETAIRSGIEKVQNDTFKKEDIDNIVNVLSKAKNDTEISEDEKQVYDNYIQQFSSIAEYKAKRDDAKESYEYSANRKDRQYVREAIDNILLGPTGVRALKLEADKAEKEYENSKKSLYYFSIPDGEYKSTGKSLSDSKYEYINSERRPLQGENSWNLYRNMTDREIGIYNYLYQNEGKAAAEDFLDFLEDDLENRKTAKTVESAVKMAEEHPVVSAGLSIFAAPITAAEQVANSANYLITGELERNTASDVTNILRSGLPEQVDFEIGKFDAFDFLYNTAMSGIDSILMAPLGNVGAVALGLSAAASTTNDIIDRGGSDSQAFWGGLAAGVFEGFFEKYSIGNLKAMKESAGSGFKVFAGNLTKSMLVNCSEETATEISNILYDYAANGGISQYALLAEEFMENNPEIDEKTAKRMAADQLVLQIIEAGASGALMGFGFGTVGSAFSHKNASSIGKIIAANGMESQIIDLALRMDKNSNAYKLAERVNTSGKMRTAQIGSIAAQIMSELSEKKTSIVSDSFYKRAVDLGISESKAQNLAKRFVSALSGEKVSNKVKNSLRNEPVVKQIAEEIKNPEKNAWVAKMNTQLSEVEQISKQITDATSVSNLKNSTLQSGAESGIINNGGDDNVISNQGTVSGDGEERYAVNAGRTGVYEESTGKPEKFNTGGTQSSSQKVGERNTVNHGNSQVSYITAGSDNTEAYRAYEAFENAGIKAVYCDGEITRIVNGATITRTEAFTAPDGTVYISNKAILPAKEIYDHERVHVADFTNSEAYADYDSVLCENIDCLSDAFQRVAGQINDNQFGGKYDINDVDSFKFLIREIAAYINQYVLSDPEFAESTFSGMFDDWNTVVDAVHKFNTDMGADFSESASFLPENNNLQSGAEADTEENSDNAVFHEPERRDIAEKLDPYDKYKTNENGYQVKDSRQRHIERVANKLSAKITWSEDVKRGKYIPSERRIVLNPNMKTSEMYNFVFKHEFTHYLEGKKGYTDFKNYVFEKSALFEKWVRERLDKNGIDSTGSREEIIKRLTQVQYEAYRNSDELSKVMRDRFTMNDAEAEVLADFVGENLLGTGDRLEQTLYELGSIEKKHRGIIRRIRDFISDLIARYRNEKRFGGLVKDLEYLNDRLKRVAESADKKISDTETEKYSIEYNNADVNENVLNLVERVKAGEAENSERVYIGTVTEQNAEQIFGITKINVSGYKIAIEARQIEHILKDHGENGKTDHSMSDSKDIAKIPYIINNPESSIVKAGTTNAYVSNVNGKNKPAQTVLYEKPIGEKSYYVIQAIPDTEKKTLYIVSAFIGKQGYKKETLQTADVKNPGATPKSETVNVSNNRVPKDNNIVKNNISENSENDTKTVKSLSERVSGDELLNAEDLIDEIKSIGGEVDDNGYITLYHRTTEQAKEKILSSGKMTAKEDGIFFSTQKDGQADGYGDSVIKMRIPAEKLILDDIFDDEAHLRYPLENRNSVLNVSEYINSENDTGKNSIAVLPADELLDKYDRGEITREEYLKQTDSMTRRAALEYVREWEEKNGAILKNQRRLEEEREKAVELEREEQQMRKDRESNIGAIRRTVRKLDHALRANTNAKHIPEAYKNVVANFCKLFVDNDQATFEHKELADIYSYYSSLKGDENNADAPQYDPYIDELLKSLIDTLSGKKLTELNSLELNQVRTVTDALNYTVDHEAQVFIDGKKAKYEEVGRAALNDIESADPIKLTGALKKESTEKIREFFYEGNMLPEYFLKRMGGTFEKAFKGLADGQNKWARNMEISRKFVEDVKSKYDYDEWKDTTVSLRTESGANVEITIDQAMQLVATAQRERSNNGQRAKHLSIGGVVIDTEAINKAMKKQGKSKEDIAAAWDSLSNRAVQITFEDVDVISKMLTDAQKGYIKDVVDFLSTQCAVWGNEVTMEQYGYRQFNESNYFPYVSSELFLTKDPAKAESTILRRASFTHSLQKNANNPLVLTSFTDIALQHMESMCNFNAMTVPLETLNKIFNYKTESGEGKSPRSVKAEMKNVFGSGAVDYMQNLIKDLNTGVRGDQRDSFLNKMTSLFKKNAVLANLSVIFQQPTAIIRSGSDMKGKYFAKAAKYFSKNNYEECKQYAPIAIIKQMGRFDTGVGVKNTTWLSGEKTVREKADDVFGWGAGKADEIAWSYLWSSVKAEIADTTDLKIGSEEFLTKAGERFTELVNKTQVYDSVLTKSQNMRNKGLVGAITSFMSEPKVALNMVVNSLLDFNEGKISGKKFSRTVMAVATAEIVTAMMQSFITAARDDDEDKSYLEKYLKNVVSNSLSNFNLAGKIPYIRDIMSKWEGYDVERGDIKAISDFIEAFQTLTKENKTVPEKIRRISESLSALFGIPLKNIDRDIEAIAKTIYGFAFGKEKTDAEGLKISALEGVSENNILAPFGVEFFDFSKTGEYERMAEAAKSGDKKTYSESFNRLIEKGIEDSDIRTGITKQFKNDKTVKKESAKYVNELNKNDTFKSFEDEDKEKLEGQVTYALAKEAMVNATEREPDEYDKLYELYRTNKTGYNKRKKEMLAEGKTEKQINDGLELAKYAYLQSKGIDLHEYLLYKMATSEKYADKDDSGGVSKAEKKEAVENMDIDEKTRGQIFRYLV